MKQPELLTLDDDTRERLRHRALTDLWWLNEVVFNHGPIPMVERTHIGMLMFADRKTGIPEIDNARVQRILVPREFGKSKMITLTRSVRNILRDPNHTIGIANETMLMAKGFLGEIKAAFETNEFIRALFPEVIPPNYHDTTWAADQIVIPRNVQRKEPTVLAAGVDRTVTGVHMGEWVLDDIMSTEAAENARTGSFTEIEKIKRWMNRLEPLCDGPGTPISIIGTPWWEGDCYDYAEDLWGQAQDPITYNWVVRLPDGTSQVYPLELQGELATFRMPLIKDGKNTFPEKWPEIRWQPIQRNDPQLFAANFMLEPSSDIVRDLKDEWLRYYDWESPQQVKYRDRAQELKYVLVNEFDCVMAVDPAISEAASADRSAIVVSGTLDGVHHLLLEVRAERLGVLDLCTTIEQLHKRFPCRRIYVESVAYQKALAQLLAAKGLPIVEFKPGTSKTKEMRIRALEPYFRQGHIYIHSSQQELLREYRAFPRGRWDDVLDALSMLTDEWSRTIGRDNKSERLRREHDLRMQDRLRSWGFGRRTRAPNR